MLVIDHKSEPIYEYPVEIKAGVLTGFNRAEFDKEVTGLNGFYVIQLRKRKRRRTNNQNRVQWWYFTEIAKETGHTPSRIKAICQAKFLLRDEVNEETGEVLPYIMDTSELTTLEHNDFMEDVRQWAFDYFGMVLPLPDPFHDDEG